MFELETAKGSTTFNSSADAENAIALICNNGTESWVYCGVNTLLYTSGDGTVTDRNGNTKVLSCPLWLQPNN